MKFRSTVLLISFLIATVAAHSQVDDPALGMGFTPFGSYHGGDLDTVNLSNGFLNLHIPLIEFPERGSFSYSALVLYNNKGWSTTGHCSTQLGTCQPNWVWGSGKLVLNSAGQDFFTAGPRLATQNSNIWVFTAATGDGAKHDMALNASNNAVTLDGTGIWNLGTSPTPGYSLDKHGVLSTVVGTAGKLEDPNGNLFTYSTANQTTITDPLGRVVPFNTLTAGADSSGCTGPKPIASASTISFPGYTGQTRIFKFCYVTIPVQTNFRATGYFNSQLYAISETSVPNATMLQSIVIYNGTSWPSSLAWTFEYDDRDPGDSPSVNYGNLTKITLPTGGTITYSWSSIAPCDPNSANPFGRGVLTRTVDAQDGSGPKTWRYNTLTGTVTDPDGNDTVRTFSHLGTCSLYETKTQFYQGSGGSRTLLKTVATDYQYLPNPYDMFNGGGADTVTNVFPIRETTTWPSGQVSKTEKTYDANFVFRVPGDVNHYTGSYGELLETREYAYGNGAPGPLLRTTDYTYKVFDGSPQGNAFLANNMLDRISTITVRDGSGNMVAQTKYGYDEYALQASNVTTQFDSSPLTQANRGNRTSESYWLNTTNTMVTTTTSYYDTGTPYQVTDPGGHTATNTYGTGFQSGVDFAGAHVTKMQNALNQTGFFDYDYNTGLPTGTKDSNGAVTTTSYDFYGRIHQRIAANQGTTTLTYADTQPPTFTASTTVSTTPSVTITSEGDLDGLGRAVHKKLTSDPEGADTVDLTYDGEGRVATASNPHRSTASTIDGVTTSIYDALGRVTQVIAQDGSITSTDYSQFPIVTVTDPANNKRQSRTDAFGRLVEVDEPGDSIAGTPAGGSVNISGSLQSTLVGGSAGQQATGSITITGAEASRTYPGDRYCAAFAGTRCVDWEFTPSTTVYDSGTMTAYVNGQPFTYTYGASDSVSTIASALASSIRTNSATTDYTNVVVNTGVTPPAATISLTARSAGTAGNGITLGTGATSYDTTDFTVASFAPSVSGATLTGGVAPVSPTAVYDAGTVTMSVGGISATANYGNSGGQDNSPASVAADLVAKIKAQLPASSPAFSISVPLNSTAISVQFNGPGPQSASVTSNTTQTAYFSTPSFSAGCAIASNPQLCNVSLGGSSPIPSSLSSPYITLYSYDALGNLLCVEQHGNVSGTGCSASPASDASSPWRVRRFTYDSLSRLLTAHNPESGLITYSYDADGNLLQKTSPLANQTGAATQTISYCYDALHRVTGKGYGAQACPLASPVVTYSYDVGTNGNGHLTSLTDQAGSATFAYDNMGGVSTETRVINGVSKGMSYDYNLDGSIKAIHYPSSAVVTYTPSSAGRMLSAIDAGNNINYATSASYNAPGSLVSLINGNNGTFAGITNTFSYNKRLQPINMSASAPSQTVFSIGYDFHVGNGTSGADNGNVWGITNYKDNSRNQSFTYDSLNRLTSAQNAGTNCAATVNGKTEYWGNSYGYDAWGNLTSKNVTKCSAENLSAPALVTNQLSGYGYDAAGNMTNDPTDGLSLTYDQGNRIKGAGGYSYTYDADGNRVLKTNGSTGTLYWYMSPGIVAESDLSGVLKSEYVFFDGERVARRDLPAGAVSYYFADHLKTASVVTDSLGNIKSESDYYPWGGELQFVNNDSNHYKFTGKERDETGLDYFGARYYSNGLARFITPDWAAKATAVPYAEFADPQSLNLYTYVRNTPLSHFDPDGHDCNTCQKIVKWLTSNHSASSSTNGAASQTTSKTGALETKASIASGQASASASYGKTTAVSAGVSGSIASTTIKEGAHSTTEMSALSGEAKASVGASGDADGARVAASASAGAYVFSASQTETVNIGPVTITGAAAGNVGVGASASGKVGTDGISGSIGLTPIAGGSLSLSISWGHVALGTGASASSTMDKATTKVDKPEVKLQ